MSQPRHGTTEMLVDFLLKRNMAALEISFAILSKKLNIEIIYHASIPVLHTYPREIKTQKTCMQMCTALFIQPKPRNNTNIHQQKNGETYCGVHRQWNSTQ